MGGGVGAWAGANWGLSGLAGKTIPGMAGGIASAASESLVTGRDFGDTLMASLPSIIGNTIGNLVAGGIAGNGRGRAPLLIPEQEAAGNAPLEGVGGTTGAGDGTAVQPMVGAGGGKVGYSAHSGTGSSAVDMTSSSEDVVEEIVVEARRDTLNAIHYIDGRGEFDDVENYARANGLDTSQENYEFRRRALVEQSLGNLTSAASFVGDMLPVVGTGKAAWQLGSGRDAVTGAPVNRWVEAGGLVLGAVPFGRAAEKIGLRTAERTGGLSALEANAPHIAVGSRPPYTMATRARDIVLGNDRVFVRVHGEGNQARSWMMRPDEIKGLSAQQIKDRFALPELPMYISDVNVPAGTRIRVGTVGRQEGWGVGGGIQYELQQRLPGSAFTNRRLLP